MKALVLPVWSTCWTDPQGQGQGLSPQSGQETSLKVACSAQHQLEEEPNFPLPTQKHTE